MAIWEKAPYLFSAFVQKLHLDENKGDVYARAVDYAIEDNNIVI